MTESWAGPGNKAYTLRKRGCGCDIELETRVGTQCSSVFTNGEEIEELYEEKLNTDVGDSLRC